jgi:hypothetical protein
MPRSPETLRGRAHVRSLYGMTSCEPCLASLLTTYLPRSPVAPNTVAMCPELDELNEIVRLTCVEGVWAGYRPPGPFRMIGLPVRCRVQLLCRSGDGWDGWPGRGYRNHDVVDTSAFVAAGDEHTHTQPQRGGNYSSCDHQGRVQMWITRVKRQHPPDPRWLPGLQTVQAMACDGDQRGGRNQLQSRFAKERRVSNRKHLDNSDPYQDRFFEA